MSDQGAYVGRCPGCNVIRAAVVIRKGDEDRIADAVADMIRSGLYIERATHSDVRIFWGPCKCEQPQQLPLEASDG